MTNPSIDDALQPKSDIFDPKKDEPRLAEDNDTPAAPATDTGSKPLPADDPRIDPASDIDSTELYDEGLTSATESDTWDETQEQPKGWRLG